MPRGRLTKVDMLSRVYKIFNELDHENNLHENKILVQKYLHKVLNAIEEYSN
tara:strand:- start:317 stop:472 length:156 start_codon:yes stop_codon:yes gene_type:complete